MNLQQNANWWTCTTDKKNDFTVDFIKEDNPTYNFPLLQHINSKVCTTDSQEQQFITYKKPETVNNASISFFCEVWNYRRNQFIDTQIISYRQRPYLELITSAETGQKIVDRFKKDRYVGVTSFNGKHYQSNNTMRNLLKSDTKQFQTNNLVILTYYELNIPITNNNHITTKWLTPTTFKYDHHWQNIHYAVNSRLCHLPGYENEKNTDLCILFLIGKNPQVNINHIFNKISTL